MKWRNLLVFGTVLTLVLVSTGAIQAGGPFGRARGDFSLLYAGYRLWGRFSVHETGDGLAGHGYYRYWDYHGEGSGLPEGSLRFYVVGIDRVIIEGDTARFCGQVVAATAGTGWKGGWVKFAASDGTPDRVRGTWTSSACPGLEYWSPVHAIDQGDIQVFDG